MTFSPNEEDRLWREPEKTSWFTFPNPIRFVIFLIVLVCVLIGLWYLIAPRHPEYDKPNLPLIQAETTAYKIKAESQGVPSVKHQDKLVYGRIRADQTEPVAEHILPDPEPPLPHIKEDTVPLKMIEEYIPEDGDPDKIADVTSQKPEAKGVTLTSIEDLIEDVSEEKPLPEKKIVKGKVLIQLGSLKGYDIAESEWERLSKKHADVLGTLDPIIQKVDLGEEQGIYYRLRTGPFEDREKASTACGALKERKVECVVVPQGRREAPGCMYGQGKHT